MKKLTTILLFSTILMTACTQDDISKKQALQDGSLRFAPEMADDWNAPWTRSAASNDVAVQQLQDGLFLHTLVSPGISRNTTDNITRSGKYTGTDDGDGNKTFATDGTETFHVSGYRYAATGGVGSVNGANFLSNAEVTYNGGQWRATNQNYVMPAATDKIDFFGWFLPTGTTGVTANSNTLGAPQLTYTVPATLAEQPDLLTAVTRDETFDSRESYAVPLSFSHQLTAVNFVLDVNVAPGTITEVAFLNVYTTATLTVGGTWNTTDGTAPGETKFSTTFNTVSGEALRTGETIIGPLMMIPQQFTDNNQQIRIKMTIDGDEKTLYADLEGTRWEPNTTVTYRVSTSAVNVLRIGTVSYPTSWSEASTENSDIKSAYAEGDEIGVYGVDADGKVIFANKKYTLTSGSWVADDGTKSLFVPGHTYYAYYPYQTTLSGGPAENATVMVSGALPTAAQFFASAVTNWTPADDQHTAALLNAQDLQIARSNPSTISTVTFSMAHAMGLTKVTLGTSKFTTATVRYVAASTSSGSTYERSGQTISIKATNTLDANRVNALSSDDAIYCVVNGSKTLTSATGVHNEWIADVTVSAAGGTYDGTSFTAYPKDNTASYIYQGIFYSYTGAYQTFTAPINGTNTYTIECWGAQGGLLRDTWLNKGSRGGYGAYTSGGLSVTGTTSLFVYIGGYGEDWYESHNNCAGGWNGGRAAYNACGGGGATDIRLTANADCLNFTSLVSRIMVAGGGGGSNDTSAGGNAGGLTGSTGVVGTNNNAGSPNPSGGTGGTQISPGTGANNITTGFGMNTTTGANYDGGGGGGGYYGAGQGKGNDCAGGGGSSFVSGYPGCNAVGSDATASNRQHTGSPNHYSGYVFKDPYMLAGGSTGIPSTTSSGTETGHTGNGYCRIAIPIPVE